jgi:hypothetical protein
MLTAATVVCSTVVAASVVDVLGFPQSAQRHYSSGYAAIVLHLLCIHSHYQSAIATLKSKPAKQILFLLMANVYPIMIVI